MSDVQTALLISWCIILSVLCAAVSIHFCLRYANRIREVVDLAERRLDGRISYLSKHIDEHIYLHGTPVEAALDTTTPVPFVEFPCPCGVKLQLDEHLEPGQAAVINCDNCGTSHSVYLPPVQIKPTEKFELVWPFTSRQAPENG